MKAFRPRGLLALEPSAYGESFERAEVTPALFGKIAVLPIRGPLVQHADPEFESYEAITAVAARVIAGKPKALVLSIASPGGVVAGLFESAATLRSMAAAAGVPLIAYIDGQACSAAYVFACACSRIVAPPAADVGSIGVIAVMADATAQAAAQGMKFAVVTSGKRKADGNPLTALTPDAVSAKQEHVDQMAGIFFQHVAQARGLTPEVVRALEAGTFTGLIARDLRLVDDVQNLDQLLASLNEPEGLAATTAEDKQMSFKAKARANAQAVLDDDKASDEDKEDAKKCLAAFGDDDEKDDKAEGDDAPADDDKKKDEDASAEDESDDEEASTASAAAAVASMAPVAAAASPDVSSRLATLEATVAQGTDNAKRRKLFASRSDLSKEQIKSLKAVPTAALAAALSAIPKAVAPKGEGLTAAARAAAQTAPSATPAGTAAYSDTRKKQRQRMGLAAVTESAIKVEETKFSFSVHAYAQNGGKVAAQ